MTRHMSDSSTNKVAILVAGMHRSGTSALTRVLNIAGCDLPKTLMNPQRYTGNVGGFWESQAIMDLNQEILASAGSSWDDWRPFDQDWYRSPLIDEFRERARELVQGEFGSSRLFVLKDPRICRLMRFWIQVIRAFGALPLVVSPIRNPLEVATSLQVRNDIDPAVGYLIWLRHTLDAEADSRGLKRAYLRYEHLLSDAQTVVDTLGNEFGVSWPRRSSPDTETKIAEFLSSELHHHRSEDAVLVANPSISNWVKDSFEIFDRWTRGEVWKEDGPNLDRIKAAFDQATPAFCSFAIDRTINAPAKWVTHRAEAAMRRGDWTAASVLWAELRGAFPDDTSGYLRGAEALRSAGRVDEAEGLACEAVERFPDRPEGYVQRGEAAMRRGDWALASEGWGELRQVFPDHVLGYVRGAAALLNAGRVDEAEGLACEAVERFPDRPEGYVQRGEVAMRRGDWALASERWGELRQVFPDHVLGYVRGAAALLNAGRVDEAEGLACEAVKRFPNRPEGYVQRGEVAMRRGDWTAASERWGELRQVFPDHVLGYTRGAAALLNAGRVDEAEGLACAAVERFPDRPEGYLQRGEVAMRRADWVGASQRWEKLRGVFPDRVLGYTRGAEASRSADRLDEAEGLACEAVKRFPDRPEGYVQRGEVAMRRGDWTAASERWGELRQVFPGHVLGYVRGAEALRSAGRLDEAEGLACEAVKRFPNRPEGYLQRGEVAMRRGDWTAASERWGELRQVFPDHVLGYARGAEALRSAGRLDGAEGLACEAVKRFPDRPEGYLQRGEVAMRRADWTSASERWGELRQVFPDHVLGYARGAEALRSAGRVDEAEALADEAAERFPDGPGGRVQRAEAVMRRGDWALASENGRTDICNDIGSDMKADCESAVLQTLDTDLREGPGGRSEVSKRICIATPDILGPIKNGGIGTAYHHLARLLAEGGHDVVIAYVGGNAADARLMGETRAFYAGFGVAFEPIVPRPASKIMMAQVTAPTWALLDWLCACEQSFDIAHVSDWHGLGYGPLLAKSLGLAFGATHFVVHGHGPTLWNVEGNRQLLSTERELGWVFMERRSIELADTVTCGSAHLLEWMREAGYALPARSLVWPNPFPAPDPSPVAAAERAARDGARLEEVVFFGRLEPRKGIVLFVDAIDRLVRQGRVPARVTFLGGRSVRIDGPGLIRDSAEGWPVEVRTIPDFGAKEAVAYLSQPGRLAVIPSLQENSSLAVTECLHAGIPFVAAATGGTPELVAPEDRARALVAPNHIALGDRIADLATAPLRAVRPRWDFERSLEVWSRWHAQTVPFEVTAERFAERCRFADAETPLVTVCIIHHERPELVRMAVDSVVAQDYPALEAVLVDDGSESAEALAALDALEVEFGERGWRVIRQENRFKGAVRNTAAAAARGEWILFLDDDNVLFPDAVSRLVRAARFSGADCVPAASIRFFGDGDPRTDPGSHGPPIRFLGAARAWSHFHNVVGDTCALVRREVFEAVGGFSEEYRVGLEDLSFFNRLIRSGHRIEPTPDPAYYYRFAKTSTKSLNRSAEAAQSRVLASHIEGLSDEERAFFSFAVGQADISTVGSFKSPKVVRMLAEQAMRRRYWPLACDLWSELRDGAPEQGEGYVRGAEALVEAGRLDEAEGLAVEAVSRFPDRPGGYVQRAEVAMRRGDWELASERWGELRGAFPEHASGYVRGAEALVGAGRLDEAEGLAVEAAERFPDRLGGYVQRAEVVMRREDWALASERWGELRSAFPDHASGYLRGAEALVEAARLDEAEGLACEAVSRFPNRLKCHIQRAEVAMLRGDWTAASALWGELRRAFPNREAGYVGGAEALLHAGRLDEAEALAGEAVKHFPRRSRGHIQQAEIAMRRGDWTAASEGWGELRREFPNREAGYLRGAKALLNAGRPDEAEALAVEAVSRFPDLPGGHYRRAEVAMRRRDWEAARGSWSEMCRALTDNPAGHVRGMTLVRPRAWFGVGNAHASILLDPDWAAQAGQRRDRGPILELRRNGRVAARAFQKDLSHDVVQFAVGPHIPTHREALYSLHDAYSGEVLAALAAPAFLRARRIVGAVENCRSPEIRGWLLDQGDSERSRRAAVHVDGRLRKIMDADNRRADIARWKGTDGQHGFRWRLPEELAGKDGTRIDVFDADTGRPLRGSPVRIEGGRVVVSGRRRT